jgi:Asp-tRNA(Asn)/Glu-tRNA(Gln) amidotransferase A subunit family amidase
VVDELLFLNRYLDAACLGTYSRLLMPFDAFSSISEIASAVRARKVSAVELTQAHLERIHRLQPKLNAFVHIDSERALASANRIDAASYRGEINAALLGVPITVKSCIDVADWPSPAGSLLRKDIVASQDAPLVARLRSAGAVFLGNTNTPEFLMAYETDNRLTGKTSNPWSFAHSAGGSSGGEAAAIASGCSAGGVGSDGGGSIRVPAHFCGICGLKPTPGRIPISGHFPAGGGAFAWIGVVGPMARTVSDLRLLFSVLAGPDPGDALSAPVPLADISVAQAKSIGIGLLESAALGKPTEDTSQAVDRAAKLLQDAGFIIEPVRLNGLDRAIELWWFFFGAIVAHLLRPMIAGKESLLSAQLIEYFRVATNESALSVDRVLQACAARDQLREGLIRQMSTTAILLSPVANAPAFLHGEGGYAAGAGYLASMRYSQWLNLAGFPGITVPISFSADGLPIGVQLIGRPYEDELVLAVAQALESARGRLPSPAVGV